MSFDETLVDKLLCWICSNFFDCVIHFVSCVMTLRLRFALRACHRLIIGHDNQAALTANDIVNDNANGTRKTETENLNW
jgi:hypothetical protein